MQLRCTSVVQYLLVTGWLSRATLVRSRLEVVPIGRRNNNFRVTNGDIELFVKQVHRNEQGAWLTVWREGVLYSEVAARPHLSPLRSLVPRFLGWDPERGVVLTERRSPHVKDVVQPFELDRAVNAQVGHGPPWQFARQ